MLPLLDPVVTINSLDLLTSDPPLLEDSRQKFLRFSLGSQDSGMLPLEKISEVLSVAVADILPVPEMPSCVLGIYNWRGKMLWLIDLENFADRPLLSQQGRGLDSLRAMVIQIEGQYRGLVVQYINDIELYDAEQLQPPLRGLFPPRLLPFVKGYLPGANGIVLDIEAIARFPMWQVHRS